MTVDKETFLSNNRKDYKWPSLVPLVPKPSQPPITTKPNNFYVAKLIEPYCHCDAHLYEPTMGRYKMLAEKEKLLHEELQCLNNQMAVLAGDLLDQPCDTYDDKMMTIYQIDYNKKGLRAQQYRQLMPAVDSPIGVPFEGPTISGRDGYRDPTSFRISAFPKPRIDVCPPVTYSTTPQTISDWFTPSTGRSEYQDTISKMGLSIMKSSQQYAEPLPSSRRRYGDMCIYIFDKNDGFYDNEINLECKGKKYVNVTLTAYYPDYDNEDHERGYIDQKGKSLRTLQDYLDNRAPFVTLAMDVNLGLKYGTKVCIPELNQHFGHRILLEVRDSSSDLQESGYKRADICVRSEIDSYDVTVNRKVTLVFV